MILSLRSIARCALLWTLALLAPAGCDDEPADVCDSACDGHGTCVYHEDPDHICACDPGYHEDGTHCVPDAADGDADTDVDADVDADADADEEQEACTGGEVRQCGATDMGECEYGTETCVGGVWGECEGAIEPAEEQCDTELLDENCDGSSNEGCACSEGETIVCGTDVGRCEAGLQTCRDGFMSDCEGSVGPIDETCDGVDEDCDSVVDNGDNACGGVCSLENAPGEACDGGDTDLCPDDVYECVGLNATECSVGTGEAEECNRSDDDCDGTIDEDCTAPAATTARFPWNGYATGSVHASAALRPTFRWESVADAIDYQLQVDDSCTTPGFATCAFPSPELDAVVPATSYRPLADLAVSLVQPVGRRYYWRVRSCRGTACAAWTSVRYLDVGRQMQDFNGDGFADVVVGAFHESNPEAVEGNAFVYDGSAAGISTTPTATLDNPADQASAEFGVSVAAAGDVNGDGFADLVVGANLQDNPESNEGNVFVYHGSAAGVPTTPTTTLDNPADQAGGNFGFSVASAGDVNGDGFADIIVGANNQSAPENREGNVFVFDGSAAGVSSTPAATLDNPGDQANGEFGYSVASAGDVNGDGFADLVVGAQGQSTPESSEGNAFVFHGSSTGASTTPATTLDNPADQASGLFGGAVASAGDVNGDGFADVVVGAYAQDAPESNEGNAFVYHGSPAGIPATPAMTLDDPGDRTDAIFGAAFASGGDVNGDGFDDLVVSAMRQSNPEDREGNLFVFHGSAVGVLAEPTTTIDNPADQAMGQFGVSAAGAGDVNGDGFADVVAGANWQDSTAAQEGSAFVFHGSAAGLSVEPDASLDNPLDQEGGMFGVSVASADAPPPPAPRRVLASPRFALCLPRRFDLALPAAA